MSQYRYSQVDAAIYNAEGEWVASIEREGEAFYVEVADGKVTGGRYVRNVEDALTFVEWKIDGRWERVSGGYIEAPIARVD